MDLVELFAEDRFRFRVAPAGSYKAGDRMEVRVLEVRLEGGEWLVDPRRSELEAIGTITL